MASDNLPLIIGIIGIICLLIGIVIGIVMAGMGGPKQPNKPANKRPSSSKQREAERLVQAERERMKFIYELISSLTASLNYRRIIDNILDLSAKVLALPETQPEYQVSAVLLFAKGEDGTPVLEVGSCRRFTPSDQRIQLPGAKGLLKTVIDEGEGCISADPADDPEVGRIMAMQPCKVVYSVPLRAGLETYGVLILGHPEPNYFTPERRQSLDIIANQAAIAIQNARLYSNLEQEKERMTEIQEEARKKLARDLHDGPTQSVAAIAMRLNFARRLMERDVKATTEELLKIEELARRTTKEIRHMLFTLRPLVLESQGLIAAFEAMAEKMRETYNQNVIIDADTNVIPDLELGKQGVIFYIAEEAVNNARKHAQAKHIWVRLKSMTTDVVALKIEDDGVGFDVDEVQGKYETRGSLGMVNMRERSELVNGILSITSTPGRGACVQVIIPLTEDAADKLRMRK